jgi:protein AroM
MRTFGCLTIGQAPRDDVLWSMIPRVNNRDVIQHGALDGLTLEQVKDLHPKDTEKPLVSRMRDGTEVLLSKGRLIPHLQSAVDRAVADGAEALVILCTGEFAGLNLPRPTIFPDRVLGGVVKALLTTGTIGVLMPHLGQMETMRKKWESPAHHFIGAAASPYSAPDDLAALARRLADDGADLLVMDCMGYTAEMKASVSSAVGIPVILANRLIGRVIEEMMFGDVIPEPSTGVPTRP